VNLVRVQIVNKNNLLFLFLFGTRLLRKDTRWQWTAVEPKEV
jgi:hypothetical protein